MTVRTLVTGLALSGTALLSWWLYQQSSAPGDSAPDSHSESPDYYFRDFTLSSTDSSGALSRRLYSPYMAYYPSIQQSRIERPEITVYDESVPFWSINAETGTLSQKGDDLLLRGDVIIRESPDNSENPATLVTRDLHIRTAEENMDTRETVTIRSNDRKLTGTGMRANLADRKIILESRVTASHVAK